MKKMNSMKRIVAFVLVFVLTLTSQGGAGISNAKKVEKSKTKVSKISCSNVPLGNLTMYIGQSYS